MLVAERGASSNTLDAYRRDLLLSQSCRRAWQGFPHRRHDALRQYMHAQAKAGMSARTSARRLSALRQLFQFLFAKVTARQPFAADRPAEAAPALKFLSEEEVDRLLAAAAARSGT